MDELEKLRKENSQLRAVCSIINSSLMADCRYNTELLNRLLEMNETEFDGIHADLNWRLGSRFQVVDAEGEHDPVWIVTPNGEMFELNHYDDKTTDIARAQWIVETLNKEWDEIRASALKS